MMRGKKIVYLFAALLLPTLVFVFLKFFGRNEFHVEPLFINEPPHVQAGCFLPLLPYHVPDSTMSQLPFGRDSLALILFSKHEGEVKKQLNRVGQEFQYLISDMKIMNDDSKRTNFWKQCIFFLSEPLNLVLVDRSGQIRGQYNAHDREDVDRLMTELTIIQKKY